MPMIETFSPVCPRVRYGIVVFAAWDRLGGNEPTKPAAATVFTKSLRSIEPPFENVPGRTIEMRIKVVRSTRNECTPGDASGAVDPWNVVEYRDEGGRLGKTKPIRTCAL
jgi:hypothetical protein